MVGGGGRAALTHFGSKNSQIFLSTIVEGLMFFYIIYTFDDEERSLENRSNYVQKYP